MKYSVFALRFRRVHIARENTSGSRGKDACVVQRVIRRVFQDDYNQRKCVGETGRRRTYVAVIRHSSKNAWRWWLCAQSSRDASQLSVAPPSAGFSFLFLLIRLPLSPSLSLWIVCLHEIPYMFTKYSEAKYAEKSLSPFSFRYQVTENNIGITTMATERFPLLSLNKSLLLTGTTVMANPMLWPRQVTSYLRISWT